MDINEEEKDSLLLSDEDNLLDDSLEDNSLISENKIDEIAEANASLSTMDSDPFNLIKDVNSTLSKIEKKIDKDSAQLSKLDQLEEIKDELKKITKSDKINQFNDVIDNDTNSPTDGDNLPGNTDLIIQIENLQEKIQKIEASNNTYEEKLKDIEETLDRFKKIENELEVEVIEEEIGKNELNEKDIFNNKIDDMKNNEDDNYKVKIHTKQKSNVLVLLLLVLILLVSGAFILDTLGIVNLYLTQTLKTLF